MIKIPNGCCELVIENNEPKRNCFKVNRMIMEQINDELPQNLFVQFLMSGFVYNGEIYHKNKEYIYIYTY